MRLLLVLLPLLVAGCSWSPWIRPTPVTHAQVPIAVPCGALAEVPPLSGVTPDAELRKMPAGRFVLALGADRAALMAWARVAEAAVRECAR